MLATTAVPSSRPPSYRACSPRLSCLQRVSNHPTSHLLPKAIISPLRQGGETVSPQSRRHAHAHLPPLRISKNRPQGPLARCRPLTPRTTAYTTSFARSCHAYHRLSSFPSQGFSGNGPRGRFRKRQHVSNTSPATPAAGPKRMRRNPTLRPTNSLPRPTASKPHWPMLPIRPTPPQTTRTPAISPSWFTPRSYLARLEQLPGHDYLIRPGSALEEKPEAAIAECAFRPKRS